jgi:hypothetical protein
MPKLPLARFIELLPVRCVLECLVVFQDRFFGLALFGDHVAPELPGIAIVRAKRLAL